MIEIDFTKVIDQRTSLDRLHQKVQQLNEAAPVRPFQKILNGELREIYRKPKAITGSVEATAERIIKNYVKYHHRLLQNVGDPAFEQGMPGLLTCRSELAGQRTISEKTAYNHLRRLRETGIITRYRFRGSRHAFEIWIDPALLFQPERTYPQPVLETEKSLQNQAAETPFFVAPAANITAYQVTITHSNLETEKKAGGNVHSDALQSEHGNPKHGNPERQQPKSRPKWQTTAGSCEGHSDSGTGGAAGAGAPHVDKSKHTPQTAGERAKARLEGKSGTPARPNRTINRTPNQQRAILEGYLTSFWQYAQRLLYAGQRFTEYEQPLILNAIRQGVYLDFQPELSEKQWDQYQSELYKQIDLAAGYYARHPDKWVPAPYAQFREGTGYFDRENGRGFVQTRAWLQENQRNYRQSYITQRVNLAIRHLQLHRADRAPATLQLKTYIEAYRYLEHQLGRYGPVAQDRFRSLAATLGQQKPRLTPGFTKNFHK